MFDVDNNDDTARAGKFAESSDQQIEGMLSLLPKAFATTLPTRTGTDALEDGLVAIAANAVAIERWCGGGPEDAANIVLAARRIVCLADGITVASKAAGTAGAPQPVATPDGLSKRT